MSARKFFQSTVGKKVIMAITGIILVAFVIGHMAGNLLVFAGRAQINAYSRVLHASDELLWGIRSVLIVSVVLHIWSAVALTAAARAARPHDYARKVSQTATLASRTMRLGGLLLLGFIVFHLLHLTAGVIRPGTFDEHDVYANVISSFRIPWVTALYLVAMVSLGAHLFHGAWAAFRTLGISPPSAHPLKRPVAMVIAIVVWAGFTSIPLAIIARIVN